MRKKLKRILLALAACLTDSAGAQEEECKFDPIRLDGNYPVIHTNMALNLGEETLKYKYGEVSHGDPVYERAWTLWPEDKTCLLDELKTDFYLLPAGSDEDLDIELMDGDGANCGKNGRSADYFWCLKVHWPSDDYDESVLGVLVLRHTTTGRIYRIKQAYLGYTGMDAPPDDRLGDLQSLACQQIVDNAQQPWWPTTQPTITYDALSDDDNLEIYLEQFVYGYSDLLHHYFYDSDADDMCTEADLQEYVTNSYPGSTSTVTDADYKIQWEKDDGTFTSNDEDKPGCVDEVDNPPKLMVNHSGCKKTESGTYRLRYGTDPDYVYSESATFFWKNCADFLNKIEIKNLNEETSPGTQANEYRLNLHSENDSAKFGIYPPNNNDVNCGALVYTTSIDGDTHNHVTLQSGYSADVPHHFEFSSGRAFPEGVTNQKIELTVEVQQSDYTQPGDTVLSTTFYIEQYECVPVEKWQNTIKTTWEDNTYGDAGSITVQFPVINNDVNTGFAWHLVYDREDWEDCPVKYAITVTDPMRDIESGEIYNQETDGVLTPDPSSSSFYPFSSTWYTGFTSLVTNTGMFNQYDLSPFVGTYVIHVVPYVDSIVQAALALNFEFIIEANCDSGDMLSVRPLIMRDGNGYSRDSLWLDVSSMPLPLTEYVNVDNEVPLYTFNDVNSGFEGFGYFSICGELTIEITSTETGFYDFYPALDYTIEYSSNIYDWPAIPEDTHSRDIELTIKAYYTDHQFNIATCNPVYQEATFTIQTSDCSVMYVADQKLPFIVYENYEPTKDFFLVYHDDLPQQCMDLPVLVDTINGEPFSNFSYISKDPDDKLKFTFTTTGAVYNDAIHSGPVKKEFWGQKIEMFLDPGTNQEPVNFELHVCQIWEPYVIYKSGVDDEINWIDLQDLPSTNEKLINLKPYQVNDPVKCGKLSYGDLEVVHSGDLDFDFATNVVLVDYDAETFDLKFKYLDTYLPGMIDVTIHIDSDTFDHSDVVEPLYSITVRLNVVDCIDEGKSMSISGADEYTLDPVYAELRLGSTGFDQNYVFTETYNFDGLDEKEFPQNFCDISVAPYKITCEDFHGIQYIIKEFEVSGSNEVQDSVICGHFVYSTTAEQHSLQTITADYPTQLYDTVDSVMAPLNQKDFQGDYKITVEALHPSGGVYEESKWEFKLTILVDCNLVVIPDPSTQYFDITPPVFWNGGVLETMTDLHLHYWFHQSVEFEFNGFDNEFSSSCTMDLEVGQVNQTPYYIYANDIWKGFTGVDMIWLETDPTGVNSPLLKISTDRNFNVIDLLNEDTQATQDTQVKLFVEGYLVCMAGMDCTAGEALDGAQTTRVEFEFIPHTDCSNESDVQILRELEQEWDETIHIGVTGYDTGSESVQISFPQIYFKDQSDSDSPPIFVHDSPTACQDFTVEFETNAKTVTDLFDDDVTSSSFLVRSNIKNDKVENTDGCDLGQYDAFSECEITYKVSIKMNLIDQDGDTLVKEIAIAARGTITFVSECMQIEGRFNFLALSYWHLSTADKDAFDDTLCYGYQVSFNENYAVEFDLPYVQPTLATGDDLIETCGNIVYTITTAINTELADTLSLTFDNEASAFLQTPSANSLYTSASVRVQTTQKEYALEVPDYNDPYETKYEWFVTAKMETSPYDDLFTFDFADKNNPISLNVYDHCYGMTLDGPPDFIRQLNSDELIKFNMTKNMHYDDESSDDPADWKEVEREGYYTIMKHIKSGESNFKMFNVNFTRPFDDYLGNNYQVNQGCGDLLYEMTSKSWDWEEDNSLFIQPEGSFDQPDGTKLWGLFGDEKEHIGNHEIVVTVKALQLDIGAPRVLTFDYILLDCLVEEYYVEKQTYADITMGMLDYELVPFKRFTQVPACEYNVEYTITVLSQPHQSPVYGEWDQERIGETPDPDFVVWKDLQTLAIETTNYELQGTTWTVYVSGLLKTNTTIQEEMMIYAPPFQVAVLVPNFKPNDPPTIDITTPDLKITADEGGDYLIGHPYDKLLDKFGIEKWGFGTLAEEDIPLWIQLEETEDLKDGLYFSILPTQEDIGFKTAVFFTLLDQNEDQPMSKEFSFTVTVLAPIVNTGITTIEVVEKKVEVKKPSIIDVSVERPDTNGLFAVGFSKYISLPRNCTEWTNQNEGADRINIEYLPSEKTQDYMYDQDLKVTMYWKVVMVTVKDKEPIYSRNKKNEIEEVPEESGRLLNTASDGEEEFHILTNSIQIELDFTEPRLVSKSVHDSMTVAINETMFSDEMPGQQLTFIKENYQDYFFDYKIPKLGMTSFAAAQDLAGNTDDLLKRFFGANFLISLLSAGVLQYLWGMIHTLQIIVLMALFNLQTPFNANMIMITILKLCGLEFISTEAAIEYLFDFRETEAMFTTVTETGETYSKWSDSGFETSIFIQLLGPIFFLPILFVLMLLAKRLATKMVSCCKDNFLTRKIREKIDILVVFVRFVLEGCIELGISAMISVTMCEEEIFENGWEIFSFGLACICIMALLAAPFFLNRLINRHLQEIEESPTKDRQLAAEESQYYSLFEYFKPNKLALRYSIIFFTRRYVIILVLTVMPGFKYVQILSQSMSSIFIISYVVRVKPFVSNFSNKQEIWNEIFVMMACYPLYTFTDWVWDDLRKDEMGWWLVACIVLNIMFNIIFLTFIVIKDWWFKARVKYVGYKKRQISKRQIEKKEQQIAQAKARQDEVYKMFELDKQGPHKDSNLIIGLITKDSVPQTVTNSNLIEMKGRSGQPAQAEKADQKIELVVKKPTEQLLSISEQDSNLFYDDKSSVGEKSLSGVSKSDQSDSSLGSLYDIEKYKKAPLQSKKLKEGKAEAESAVAEEEDKFESPDAQIEELLERGQYAQAHDIVFAHYGCSITKYQLRKEEEKKRYPISGPNMMGVQPNSYKIKPNHQMMYESQKEAKKIQAPSGSNTMGAQSSSFKIKPSRPIEKDLVGKAWGTPTVKLEEPGMVIRPKKSQKSKKKCTKKRGGVPGKSAVRTTQLPQAATVVKVPQKQPAKTTSSTFNMAEQAAQAEREARAAGKSFDERFNQSLRFLTAHMEEQRKKW